MSVPRQQQRLDRPALSVLRALVREPMVHFVVLGAILFGAHGLRNEPEPNRVVVTTEDVERQVARARAAGLPPVDRQALVEALIDDEVLYREALALGLDQGDSIIRTRLVQKMEFLLDTPRSEPAEADFENYYRAHAGDYVAEARVSFEHVYCSPKKRVDEALPGWRGFPERLRKSSSPEPGPLPTSANPSFGGGPP